MQLEPALSSVKLPTQSSLLHDLKGRSYDSRYSVGGAAEISQFFQLNTIEYELEPGETLSDLAYRFNISMGTIASFNSITDARSMQANTSYRIPDRDGLLYVVKSDDTLDSIANDHSIDRVAILDTNHLASALIRAGDQLFLPNAAMSDVDLRLIMGELLIYPYRGWLTSGFGYRNDPFTGQRRFHNGIDIGGPAGATVKASMAGRVAHAAHSSSAYGYGSYIVIHHSNGFQTLYAHLGSIAVSAGEYVNRGQKIGTLGSTGRSTGPHLHFSVIRNNSYVNPLYYISLH